MPEEKVQDDATLKNLSDDKLSEEDELKLTASRIKALGINSDDPLTDDDDESEDSTSEEETEDSTSEETQTEETDEIQTEETDKTEETEKVEETEDSTSEETQTEKKVELSDAYYRAAVHRGWKPEEIKEFFVSNPELANRTFANIYEGVNQSTKEFADLGRIKLQQQKESVQAPQQQQQQIQQEKKLEFKGVDVDKLKKDYGTDEPLVDVIATMQEQNRLLFEQAQNQQQQMQQQVQQQQSQIPNQELKVADQQIDSFFTSDDLKLYEDFYGPGKDSQGNIVQPDDLTPGHRANRKALLQIGGEIVAGTALQGREMSVPEALGLAHLRVTRPIREQKIREDIMSKVVKRSKSITLKGSGKKQPVDTGKPLDDAALEVKTKKAIKKLLKK